MSDEYNRGSESRTEPVAEGRSKASPTRNANDHLGDAKLVLISKFWWSCAGSRIALNRCFRRTDKEKLMRTRILFITLLAAIGPVSAASDAKTIRIAAATQSWAAKDRTLNHVLALADQAAAQRSDIIVLPQDCVPTDGGPAAAAALEAISKLAARKKLHVVANLQEKCEGKLYSTSYLIGPEGKPVGKYRKSHRLPDEPIELGDALPVFDTPLGKIGLMIGTDHYWPEIPLVLALNGAELILWSTAPEAVPQGFPLDAKMRVRALDNQVVLAAADYVDDLPYLCSNWPAYAGLPLGRSYVIDPHGYILAATQYWCDCTATAELDLDAPRVWSARSNKPGSAGRPGYLAAYYPKTLPERRIDFRDVLMARRRPELYKAIVETTLADRDLPPETWERMGKPR